MMQMEKFIWSQMISSPAVVCSTMQNWGEKNGCNIRSWIMIPIRYIVIFVFGQMGHPWLNIILSDSGGLQWFGPFFFRGFRNKVETFSSSSVFVDSCGLCNDFCGKEVISRPQVQTDNWACRASVQRIKAKNNLFQIKQLTPSSDSLIKSCGVPCDRGWENLSFPKPLNSNCLSPPLDSGCRYENVCFDHLEWVYYSFIRHSFPLTHLITGSTWGMMTSVFAWGTGASLPCNYHGIVLFLTLRTPLCGYVSKQHDLKVEIALTSFFFAAAVLSSLFDPFLVPPFHTLTHTARSRVLPFLSLQTSAETNGTKKSAVSKCVWVCASKHADAAGQVLNRCSQKSFYLSPTEAVFQLLFYCWQSLSDPLLLSCQVRQPALTTTDHWATAHLTLVLPNLELGDLIGALLNWFMTCTQWHMAGRLSVIVSFRGDKARPINS